MPPAEAARLEREYVEHREPVLAMLRSEYPRLDDAEELYQEAWAELLEQRSRGFEATRVRGLLKTIAWRRARDRLRKRRPDSVDPSSPVMALAADADEPPDVQAQVRLDAAALRQIVERLEPRQAAVLKLRFDWGLDAREIQQRLGVTPKRLEKIVTEAYRNVAAELELTDGETAWTRKQRSLLLACETGLASAEQRARAQRMVDADPACRAMLREMRDALRDVAAVLPVPVLFEQRGGGVGALFERVAEAWASLKHALASALGRGGGQPAAVEQAAGAGTAGLGGAAAAKLVAACLAAGGTTAACIQAGVFSGAPETPAARAQPARPRTETPAIRTQRVVRPVERTAPKREAASKRPRRRSAAPAVSSPAAEPPPSPAPQGSTEFGPGTIGSSSAPSAAPATAPQDGGGEFGP